MITPNGLGRKPAPPNPGDYDFIRQRAVATAVSSTMTVNTVDTGERKRKFGSRAASETDDDFSKLRPGRLYKTTRLPPWTTTDGWYINLEYGRMRLGQAPADGQDGARRAAATATSSETQPAPISFSVAETMSSRPEWQAMSQETAGSDRPVAGKTLEPLLVRRAGGLFPNTSYARRRVILAWRQSPISRADRPQFRPYSRLIYQPSVSSGNSGLITSVRAKF